MYDPRDFGVDCDHCPMRRWHGRAWKPVPGQKPKPQALRAAGLGRILAIGELPGRVERERGGPYLGPSGLTLNDALREAGFDRAALGIENLVECCAPPPKRLRLRRRAKGKAGADGADETKYALIAARLRSDKEAGLSPDWEQHPAEHCRPRLDREIDKADALVLMGAGPAAAVLGGNPSITRIRGAPRAVVTPSGREVQVLPIFSPAYVHRYRSWFGTYVKDWRRLRRVVTGTTLWRDAAVLYAPTPEQLRAFLYGRWPDPRWPVASWAAEGVAEGRERVGGVASGVAYWTYDLETSREGSLKARIYCIGIGRDRGTGDAVARASVSAAAGIDADGLDLVPPDVVVVPLWDIGDGDEGEGEREGGARRGGGPYYADEIHDEIVEILRPAWTDGRLWVGQNSDYFDAEIVERWFGVRPAPSRDLIVDHSLAWSERRHGLAVVGSDYSDVVGWKEDEAGRKIATDARSNVELWEYNGRFDVPVTHVCAPQVYAEAGAFAQAGPDAVCPGRPSLRLDDLLHRLHGEVGAGMHRNGIWIDQQQRAEIEVELERKGARARVEAQRAAEAIGWSKKSYKGKSAPDFNPGSVHHVRHLLFDLLRLDPVHATEAGDPSTDEAALLDYLQDLSLPPDVHMAVRRVRLYREAKKQQEMIVPFRPRSEGGAVDDETGRLHTNWWAWRPVTTRFASGDPVNLQNLPHWLLEIVAAPPGRCLVSGDKAAVEGRVGAARWGLKKYVAAFGRGDDTHQITMELALGDRIWTLTGAPPEWACFRREWPARIVPASRTTRAHTEPGGKIGGKFDEARTWAKRYYYGKQYGAGDPTVLGLMREVVVEEADWRRTASPEALTRGFGIRDEFPYAHYTEARIAAISTRFLAALPELPAGWAREEAFVTRNGYNVEWVTGRRRRFLDGRNPNEERNFGVQGGAAGDVNLGTLDFVDEVPFGYAGPGTGLVQQGHDALVAEVPEADAPRVVEIMTAAMSTEYPEIYGAMRFPLSAKAGRTWKDVK